MEKLKEELEKIRKYLLHNFIKDKEINEKFENLNKESITFEIKRLSFASNLTINLNDTMELRKDIENLLFIVEIINHDEIDNVTHKFETLLLDFENDIEAYIIAITPIKNDIKDVYVQRHKIQKHIGKIKYREFSYYEFELEVLGKNNYKKYMKYVLKKHNLLIKNIVNGKFNLTK